MIYDVAIIGLGPAGLKFADEALRKGLKVIAFEKTSLGGTCLNLGCIPTKTMLSCAEVFSKVKSFQGSCCFSYEQMCLKRNKIVEKLSGAVLKNLKNKGVDIVNSAAFVKVENNSASVFAQGVQHFANIVVAATGSKPALLEGVERDGIFILNSNDILNLEELPKDILIVGSGAIGIEWASIFNLLGVRVSIIEAASSLLPSFDLDVSARIERIFKISKIKFYKDTIIDSIKNKTVRLSNGVEISPEKILVAAGRHKVLPEFCDNFELEVYDECKTNVKNLYVTGDASGAQMLAHVASYQAKSLFDSIYNNKDFFIPPVPNVIYTTPEIASIGLTEQNLPQGWRDDKKYTIYKLPVSFLPKAWCDDEIDGFIKIITYDNKIIGAHIVSKEASGLITQLSIAMKAKMSVDDLKEVMFAHPTYSEGICEALING